MFLACKRVARFAWCGGVLLLSGCSALEQPAAPIVQHGNAGQQADAAPRPVPETSTAYAAPAASRITPVGSTPVGENATAGQADMTGLPESYTVKPGDNLFRIALNHGMGYRELAELNGISNPADIKAGQTLRIQIKDDTHAPTATSQQPVAASPVAPVYAAGATQSGDGSVKQYPKGLKLPYSPAAAEQLARESQPGNAAPQGAAATPDKPTASQGDKTANKPVPEQAGKTDARPAAPRTADADTPESGWQWPVSGSPSKYDERTKGVDIPGKMGQPVQAAADGKVVYSGTGLRGYGKLIIIKHNKAFLSAYAHNNTLLVKEGQAVRKGQKIAEMGNSDADKTKLHFELRRYGKPVDPYNYMPQL